jgi:hypothetical protein
VKAQTRFQLCRGNTRTFRQRHRIILDLFHQRYEVNNLWITLLTSCLGKSARRDGKRLATLEKSGKPNLSRTIQPDSEEAKGHLAESRCPARRLTLSFSALVSKALLQSDRLQGARTVQPGS